MELCQGDGQCPRCDLGYVIKDYVVPLIQLLSHDLKDYNMKMQTTKCLNTGVMLMLFMVGKKGLQITDYCDSVRVVQRHRAMKDSNTLILEALMKMLLNKSFKLRQVCYVLLSDGYFKSAAGNIYFPGHVFVLEKFWENGEIYFNIYQSYINEYDLKGHFDNMNGSVRLTYSDVAHLLKKLSYIVMNDVWDTISTQYWKEITNVDASKFEGYTTTDNICTCFKSAPLKSCVNNIERYVKKKLKTINKMPPSQFDTGLSNKDLKARLESLLHDIAIKST